MDLSSGSAIPDRRRRPGRSPRPCRHRPRRGDEASVVRARTVVCSRDFSSWLIRRVGPRCIRELLVQRLAIPQAAPQELRPSGDPGQRVGLLGQEAPERRVMPAELLAGAVAVRPDALTQPPRLGDQLLARHGFEILVHATSGFQGFSASVYSNSWECFPSAMMMFILPESP